MIINQYRYHALECLSVADENATSPENRILPVGMAAGLARISTDELSKTLPLKLSGKQFLRLSQLLPRSFIS
jgi:hypothetical protein